MLMNFKYSTGGYTAGACLAQGCVLGGPPSPPNGQRGAMDCKDPWGPGESKTPVDASHLGPIL